VASASIHVAHVSRSDLAGGAAIAARRLHKGLLAQGVASTMLVAEKRGSDAEVRVPPQQQGWRARAGRRARIEVLNRTGARNRARRSSSYELFSDDRSAYGDQPAGSVLGADIVHLHWVSGFVDVRKFFSALGAERPAIWTLHDLNPFTGGCHYSAGCDKYVSHCGACPQLGSRWSRDLAYAVFERKAAAYTLASRCGMRIVAPSRWLAAEARRSKLLGAFPTITISPGLDTRVFRPRNRNVARELLGIDRELKIVLFVAQDVRNTRKGGDLLAQAMARMPKRDLGVVTVGRGAIPMPDGVRTWSLGPFADERTMSFVYSAADVFVIPSREDNSPNTLVEAMACGVPVVGFDNTGVREMVRDGKTGLLAPSEDSAALQQALQRVLDDDAWRRQMGEKARRVAVNEYDLGICVSRYVNLYRELLTET